MAILAFVLANCGGIEPTATTVTTTAGPTSSTQADDPATDSSSTSTTSLPPADLGDLLVVGDWGSGTMPQGSVAGAMARYAEDNEIAAILTTGDNFYSDDSEFLMEPFGWADESEIPFWIAWGNHDIETDQRIDVVNEVFDSPPRWTLHRWGGVDILVLDSNLIGSDEQIDFVARSLAERENPTIVVFHHPPYTCGRHDPSKEVAESWIPLFDEDVFLVLNGHDHNYQRFESERVTYVVTGGGGRRLYDLTDCPSDHPGQLAGEESHHFLVLELTDVLTVRVLDVNGDVIDQFSPELP